MTKGKSEKWIRLWARRVLQWTGRNVPPGFRFVFGLLLIFAGVFGFLPILGFWMIPLGVAVAALDIRPLGRALSELRQRKLQRDHLKLDLSQTLLAIGALFAFGLAADQIGHRTPLPRVTLLLICGIVAGGSGWVCRCME